MSPERAHLLPARAVDDIVGGREVQDLACLAQNGDDDVIFVAPGTYNLTSTLRYTPAADEEYGLAIGGYTIYDIPIINGGMTTQLMSIGYHCDADWNDFGASVEVVTNRGEIRFINNIVANNTGGGTGMTPPTILTP